MHSLEILLPTSTIYDYLEDRIQNPADSYIKIVEIVEADEQEKINREIGQRRTRLGAKIDQVIQDVKREIFAESKLSVLYNNIIEWSPSDETRRHYEEKLLQHTYDTLTLLEVSKKKEKREQVYKLAQGLVILKHPFALAWKIVLEWKDVGEIEEFEYGLLREYIDFFPEDGLSMVLKGYLETEISPFPKIAKIHEESIEDMDDMAPMTAEDRLLLMMEGMDIGPSSILSHRLMGDYFTHLGEYESAATIARQGQTQIGVESRISGLSFSNSVDAINITLATALVHHQAPRHHPEARSLFDKTLQRKPVQPSALIGIGLILEEQEDYGGAVAYFEQALKRSSDPSIKAEAAWCKALKNDRQSGLSELEDCLLEMQGSDAKTRKLRAQTLYRIGICIWEENSSKKMRKDRSGAYARFISSLQADTNFAPAYTSLGIYYADYAKDEDRARKCFHKAFELSASEVHAAERLAKSFAQTGEWDIVEAVVQRVIESGKARPAPGLKKDGLGWPFIALGVVQLNRQDYVNSAISFQSALRSSPNNYHSWVGLGESYHNSGRYIAAIRAFNQAQNILNGSGDEKSDNGWFCQYMLANVNRELGEYEIAIEKYREVLALRPVEFGVSMALLQTYVEGAWQSIERGLFGRAIGLAIDAIDIAQQIARDRKDTFNLWKGVGDACSIFSVVQNSLGDFPVGKVQTMLEDGVEADEYDVLAEYDGVGKDYIQTCVVRPDGHSTLTLALYAAILAHKRSIHTCTKNIHARAVAWYNLGWAEYRVHICDVDGARSTPNHKSLKFLKSSIQCFKRAIELEASNSEFWNALGIVTTKVNPKVSQHSFIRSLHINERSARVWTNLGAFYLMQDDYELANQAFARAQSTDPDYAHAWLGQGLLAAIFGETKDANTLFAHAFEIAESFSAITTQEYALSAFRHVQSLSSSTDVIDVLQPQFALHQLLCHKPSELGFRHLSFLFAEQIGDFSSAVSSLNMICSVLETEYESSESPSILTRFSQAKADISRIQLAMHDFTSATENAETALDLSADEDSQSESRKKLRLSANLTAGLANYHQGFMDSAIDMFRNALQETQGDPDIVCLLVRVLWTKGGLHERAVARAQLHDCKEKFPSHFDATALSCIVAILDDDHTTIKTFLPDLQELRTRDNLSARRKHLISQLLCVIATMYHEGKDPDISLLAEASTSVMLAPSQQHGWTQMAEISGGVYPAEMALLTTIKAVPPGGSLEAKDLCKAYVGTYRVDDAQRAIMVAPWMHEGWQAISEIIKNEQ